MKEKFVKIVRKNGDSLAINIPKEVIDIMKITEGDIIRVEIEKVKG